LRLKERKRERESEREREKEEREEGREKRDKWEREERKERQERETRRSLSFAAHDSLRPAYHELKKEIEDFQQVRAVQGLHFFDISDILV
jgi:hypothetical protein